MATSDPLDLTKTIGDCGLFQVAVVVLADAAYIMVAFVILCMAFGLYNPGWTCLDSDEIFNSSDSSNKTFLHSHSSFASTQLSKNDTAWSTDCHIKRNCRNLVYNPESSTVVTEWDLTCDLDWVPSVIISIQMSGTLFGSYFGGFLGEKYGRKFGIYSALALHALGQLAISFVNTWQMYAVFMFIIGMSSGAIFANCFHYPVEFVTYWWRGVLAALPVWNLGCAIYALTIYILKDWRYAHISGAVWSLITFLTVFWAPESVRWLAVRGKVDEAKKVIVRISRTNKRPCPDTNIIDDIANEEKTQMGGYKYTYVDLFKIKSVRGYSIKFGFIWIVFAVTYYAISFGIKSLSGNFYLNFFLFGILDFPAVVSVAPAITKLGRRGSSLLYISLASASSLSVVIVFFAASGQVQSMAILVLAMFCKMSIMGAWYTVKVFSGELHPTVIRSLHYGYVNSVSRIGAIISPYILSKDPKTLYLPYLTIGILTLFVCGLLCTMPETKGKELPDRATINSVETMKLNSEGNEERI